MLILEATYDKKPIPLRNFDWIVTTSNYDGPGAPLGAGATYPEALRELATILFELEADLTARCMCPECLGTGVVEYAHHLYGSPSCPSPTAIAECERCRGVGEITADLQDLASLREAH